MNAALLVLAVLACASSVRAASLETLSSDAEARFASTLHSFSVKPMRLSTVIEDLAAAKTVTIADVAKIFDGGGRIEKGDLSGWLSGRRVSDKGIAAQLLIGVEIFRDPAAGPLEGSDFKAASLGGVAPSPFVPDAYDRPTGVTLNSVAGYIRDNGVKWKIVEFKETGALAQDERNVFEIRKNGELLVAKYGDGSYAFFWKVRFVNLKVNV